MTRFPFAPVSATRAAEDFSVGVLTVDADPAPELAVPSARAGSNGVVEADES